MFAAHPCLYWDQLQFPNSGGRHWKFDARFHLYSSSHFQVGLRRNSNDTLVHTGVSTILFNWKGFFFFFSWMLQFVVGWRAISLITKLKLGTWWFPHYSHLPYVFWVEYSSGCLRDSVSYQCPDLVFGQEGSSLCSHVQACGSDHCSNHGDHVPRSFASFGQVYTKNNIATVGRS
nr:hypothetical protein Iba_chr02cCG0830 [Ipomoea batatas]